MSDHEPVCDKCGARRVVIGHNGCNRQYHLDCFSCGPHGTTDVIHLRRRVAELTEALSGIRDYSAKLGKINTLQNALLIGGADGTNHWSDMGEIYERCGAALISTGGET